MNIIFFEGSSVYSCSSESGVFSDYQHPGVLFPKIVYYLDNSSLLSAQVSDLIHFAREKQGSLHRGTGSTGILYFVVHVKNVFEEAYQNYCYSLSFAVSGLIYVTSGSRSVTNRISEILNANGVLPDINGRLDLEVDPSHHLQMFECEISKIFIPESIPFDRMYFKVSGSFPPVISDDVDQIGFKFHSSKEHKFPTRIRFS